MRIGRKHYIIVFKDGTTSLPYTWGEQARDMAAVMKGIGKGPAFIAAVTVKPIRMIANNYGKPHRR